MTRSWGQAVLARLQIATPREKLLLGCMAGALVIYVPFAAFDWRQAQQDAYSQAMLDQSAARLAASAARRVELAASNDAALADMETWSFRATNADIAGVLIEERLVDAGEQAELPNLKVTVITETVQIGPTRWLAVDVEADLLWAATFRFLDNLAAWPEGFRVVSFSYEKRPMPPGMEFIQARSAAGTVRIGLAFPVTLLEAERPK